MLEDTNGRSGGNERKKSESCNEREKLDKIHENKASRSEP